MNRIYITIFIILITHNLFAQEFQGNENQINAAKEFLNYLINEEYDKCWELFDKQNNPQITKDNFINILEQLKNLKTPDIQYLEYNGGYLKLLGNELYVYYTFLMKGDDTENNKPLIFEIVFIDNVSLKIGGVFWKFILYQSPDDNKN